MLVTHVGQRDRERDARINTASRNTADGGHGGDQRGTNGDTEVRMTLRMIRARARQDLGEGGVVVLTSWKSPHKNNESVLCQTGASLPWISSHEL